MRSIKKRLSPILLLLCFFINENSTFAASIIVSPTIAARTCNNLPAKYLNASEFVKLSAKEFSSLSGIKLNLFQKLSFGITKLRLKHDLKRNPKLKITADYYNAEKGKKFNFLWFILGMAGLAIGVVTGSNILFGLVTITTIVSAYITKDKSKIKSAWIGIGVGLLVFLFVMTLIITSIKK